MRILLVSEDNKLVSQIQEEVIKLGISLDIFEQKEGNALDIMARVCSTNPAVLVVDDDFTKPESRHLLTSIRKVNHRIKIVFITSDDSIQLGSSITPLDIHYYGIKPLDGTELKDALHSVIQLSQYS